MRNGYRPIPQGHRGLWVGLIVILIAVTGLVVSFSPSYVGSFSGRLRGCGGPWGCPPIGIGAPAGTATISVPPSTNASISWTSTNGEVVDLELTGQVAPGGQVGVVPTCAWQNLTSGGCAFTSFGGGYQLSFGYPADWNYSRDASQSISYNGAYLGPPFWSR